MKHLTQHQQGLTGVFAAAILWSSGGLLIKLVSLSPMQISFFRCSVAAITFAIIFRKKILQYNRLTVLNSFFYAGVLFFYVIAMKETTAANAIFLQSTAPIYVLIFEPIINKTRYDKSNIITIGICFLGMILFFLGDLTPGQLEGNIYGLLAGLLFAAFFLGMKKNDRKYQQSSIFLGNIIVALICLPSVFAIDDLAFSDLWMVSFLGVFQIAIAYAFFSFGLKRVLAVEASIISMVEPVLTPFWVFIGYGEVPATAAIIGGFIIIVVISVRTIQMGRALFGRKFI
ncbi:MAG: DMT family transporter [Ignavibacteriaceae bacterium]|nr:DMT family transporter [Ignavibacteriaceae bacterium]